MLVTALEACADKDMELAHVQQALIHEEIKIIEKLKVLACCLLNRLLQP